MIELFEQTGILAAMNTVLRLVPGVTLSDDGSLCGADGQVCGLCPECHVGACVDTCVADTNHDDRVNIDDLLLLLANFGRQC